MGRYSDFLYNAEKYGSDISYFEKKFIYKIYDSEILVSVWSNDVISEPSFSNAINSGPGELRVKLAREFDNFGEDVDIKLNNRVDVYLFDIDDPDGLLLYRGYISSFAPILNGGQEYVEVIIFPYSSELTRYMLRDESGNTEIAYSSQDPGSIFQDILTKYQADNGTLGSTGLSIQTCDTSVSYTFNTNTIKQAFDKCIQLAPMNWYWSVDADGIVNFKEKPSTVTHDLSIGEHITMMQPSKRVENVINRVYFTGGGNPPLYKVYSKTSSISSYGLYAEKVVDQRVTDADTAETISTSLLDENEEPEVRTKLRIIDNNGRSGHHGYDIESIKIGDTIRIKNLSFGTKTSSIWDSAVWDVDVWDYTLASVAGSALTVVKLKYEPNSLEVELSSRFPNVSKRIEDINRNLQDSQTASNPTSPS